jgi:hypothetical protein
LDYFHYLFLPLSLPFLVFFFFFFFSAFYARKARRAVPADMAEKLRYYSHAMHKAAFLLPAHFEAQLSSMRPSQTACLGHSKKDYAIYAGVAAAIGVAGFFIGKAFAQRK